MKSCVLVRLMLVVALLVLLPSQTLAQPGAAPSRIYCKHFIFGYPQGAPAANPMIIRDLYALSVNGQTKLADWVCYYLTVDETRGTQELKRNWRNEPWLKKGEALEHAPKDDYQGVGDLEIDRGHMAPLASFKGSRFISQVNYYPNIVPQKAALNGGPWKTLEDKVRDLVEKYGHVWGMSGPIYERDMPPLPQATKPHKVPSAFWMIVVASNKENPKGPKDLKVAAFIMDQDTKDQDAKKDPQEKYPLKGLVSVEEVEKRTRLNFFWELSPLNQRRLESEKAATWAQEWLK